MQMCPLRINTSFIEQCTVSTFYYKYAEWPLTDLLLLESGYGQIDQFHDR